MVHSTILMPMLAAVFLMAGAQHLLIFARNSAAVEHFWLGAAAMAAACAALAYCAMSGNAASDTFLAADLPKLAAAVWLVTSTWFLVEYSFANATRRWAVLLVTLLIAIDCVGDLGFNLAGHGSETGSVAGPWHLAGLSALAIMFALAAEATFRLLSTGRRVRSAAAAALCAAFAVTAVHNVVQGFSEIQVPAFFAFLFVVMMTAYESAGAVVQGEENGRRQQRELATASRLSIVGELTASLAHEINQPLGAILSNADAGELLLADPAPPMDEIRQIFADIRRDGLRASDVIRQVRKLVRKRELEFEKIDANVVATGVIALLEAEARDRRIPITASPSTQPAYLRGDRALIEQMLINLITNAMDSVGSTGAALESSSATPLVLGVSSTSHGEVEFQVVDTGAGIPPERLDHLFDSFYTSKAHGMGLGLSISRSIVEAHGGRIRAENNRGGGATFVATFPPFMEEPST
jgi:signal transduction histidine kinase